MEKKEVQAGLPLTVQQFICDNVFREGVELPTGTLFQASELSLLRGGEIYDHLQWCDEITYVISGRAKIYADDCCREVSAGQVHYIRKGCRHRIEVGADENLRYFCMGFIASSENKAVSGFVRAVKKHSCFVRTDDSTIKKLSELILDEFYHWDSNSDGMVSSYLMQVLVTLERLLDGGLAGTKNRVMEKQPACFTIYQVVRYIDREYQHIPNVKSIADKLSYSEYYLAHLFKEKTGITIREYLIEKKIAYACELLKTTGMSMEGIAEQVNFASAHCFRRVFKQQIGMSPSEYKRAEGVL